MSSYELTLSPVLQEKKKWRKIEWTPDMLETLKKEFPTSYNAELSNALGVSPRSLIRKARELGLDKELGFLDKRRPEIGAMAKMARGTNVTKGQKGWSVPGGEAYRFHPGHIPATKTDKALVERIRKKRNETLRRERIRIKYGMERLTKLRIKQ